MEIKFPGSLTSSLPRNAASPQGQSPLTSSPVNTRVQKISCRDQQDREREDQRKYGVRSQKEKMTSVTLNV